LVPEATHLAAASRCAEPGIRRASAPWHAQAQGLFKLHRYYIAAPWALTSRGVTFACSFGVQKSV